MSRRAGPTHWCCDQCGKDGGLIGIDETLPFRWLSMVIIVATPQIAYEQKPRTIHLCDTCGGNFLVDLTVNSEDVGQLKILWKREPGKLYETAAVTPKEPAP